MENVIEETEAGFFPSIEQFRHVIKAERERAKYENRTPAKRTYVGTVKLHGTNAGIRLHPNGKVEFLSRSRVITPDDDNYGFARAMEPFKAEIYESFGLDGHLVTIFGEWCGQGIQNNVGISAEQKMLVIFAARLDNAWIDVSIASNLPSARIYNIMDFPYWEREIDFAHPEQIQNELIALTEEVERECPVAKQFGHTGIGEGIVWTPRDGDRSSRFWFKVKGERHSASKVKVLAAVDVERFAKRDELVSALVTESRLQQGLDLHVNEFQCPLEMSAIGEYLRWVFNDIAKEETDTITASGFEVKELGRPISEVAKRFYIDAVNRV